MTYFIITVSDKQTSEFKRICIYLHEETNNDTFFVQSLSDEEAMVVTCEDLTDISQLEDNQQTAVNEYLWNSNFEFHAGMPALCDLSKSTLEDGENNDVDDFLSDADESECNRSSVIARPLVNPLRTQSIFNQLAKQGSRGWNCVRRNPGDVAFAAGLSILAVSLVLIFATGNTSMATAGLILTLVSFVVMAGKTIYPESSSYGLN